MRIFKFKETPRFPYGQKVVINKPDHPLHGCTVKIWNRSFDHGFLASLKMKWFNIPRPVKYYLVDSIYGVEYPTFVSGLEEWKPHELRMPFDPVNYYKDQPGDTRDDV